MPELTLTFSPEFMERIDYWSRKKRKQPEYFLKKIIAEHLEDLDDYEEVSKIDTEVKAGRMKLYSWEEVMNSLGLES